MSWGFDTTLLTLGVTERGDEPDPGRVVRARDASGMDFSEGQGGDIATNAIQGGAASNQIDVFFFYN